MTGYLHPSSFRDPSGFVFQNNGKIYRQVNNLYAEDYSHLMSSGLYDSLVNNHSLLPHSEIKENILLHNDWHTTLLPEQIPFISYPYEWCFEQLKDAALLTLKIVKLSVEKGMILKDATPFNIQFHKGRPVFIDSLSFEKYDPEIPWIAYRQFCETFLFPLWLSHYHKMNFQHMLAIYPDGIPVEIANKLMPLKSRFNSSVWLHLLLQNKIRNKKTVSTGSYSFSKQKLLNLVSHLESIINKLDNETKSTWSNYYDENVDHVSYLDEKKRIVAKLIAQVQATSLLDIGSNEGEFSFIAADKFNVIAIDSDEQCINSIYKKIRKTKATTLLPLCVDITNLSPAAGFANKERTGFTERIKVDVSMALALIHHLAIGKNIPLPMLALLFSQVSPQLIIEFVPKEDEKTQLLLRNRKDIFSGYTRQSFEECFKQYFTISSIEPVGTTGRSIYLMNRNKT